MPQPSKDEPSPQSFKSALKAGLKHSSSRNIQFALLAALGISFASVFIVNLLGGAERFREIIESAGPWAPLAYVGLKALTYVIAPLSGTPIKLAGGALFGFWEGAAYALAGDVIGATINFWIARFFRLKAIVRLAGKSALQKIDETTRHVGGWRALLVARLFLSSLYDFISYAAGLSNISFKHFFWVSLLGGIPSTLMAAWFGDTLVSNPAFFYVMTGLAAVLIVLGIWAGKWLEKNGAASSEGSEKSVQKPASRLKMRKK